jgi:hypothetical protein
LSKENSFGEGEAETVVAAAKRAKAMGDFMVAGVVTSD